MENKLSRTVPKSLSKLIKWQQKAAQHNLSINRLVKYCNHNNHNSNRHQMLTQQHTITSTVTATAVKHTGIL
eukprot:6963301-Ditylum_brightwellii.AAC.1